jgi:phage shock protein C
MLMERRLYRSRTDTVLGGVASGLAKYLNTDPALVRIAWAILVLITNGAALLAHVVAWVVVPEEPEVGAPAAPAAPTDADGTLIDPEAPATGVTRTESVSATGSERRAGGEGRAALIVGVGLIALGAWFLLRQYLPPIDWGLLWPIILIGIGGVILVTSARRRGEG